MEQPWRVPFSRFLKEQRAVEARHARLYVHWVGRWLASEGSDRETLTPAAVSRFIEGLGRTEKPENVRQADEAIRLYGFFRARAEGKGETATAGSAADWDALAAELTRIARLRRLSLRTSRPP